MITAEMLWTIWQTQDVSLDAQTTVHGLPCNLTVLKQLAECQMVCREWHSLIDSWRGGYGPFAQFCSGGGEHPLFQRYRHNAEQYIGSLRTVMLRLWRCPVKPPGITEIDTWVEHNAQQAVTHLSHALSSYGHNKELVRACLAELTDILASVNSTKYQGETVVTEVVWPLVCVLQGHHGDASIGMLVLQALAQIARMNSNNPLSCEICDPLVAWDRCFVGRHMLVAFHRSCPQTPGLQDIVMSMCRWLEKPMLLGKSTDWSRYVFWNDED